MKLKTVIFPILVATLLIGCNNDQERTIQINPLEELEQVDKLLIEIAETPQILTAPTDKKTAVTGAKGTIIHVDPSRLETVDGSQLGNSIQIELLEMTDISSMLLNNIQTVSNGQILITGGAYYLNMTSNGSRLKIKQGQGLEVEFPKLTANEMGFFIGERDSLGQINWIPTNKKFENKTVEEKSEAVVEKKEFPSSYYDKDLQMEVSFTDTASAIDFKSEVLKETYKSIYLMNFGWINCDRFLNDPSPKTDIQLIFNNDSLNGAIIYAVFSDINSIMTEYYWSTKKDKIAFKNIPIGKELKIMALSAKNEIPYVFETTINTKMDNHVQIKFKPTSKLDLKDRIKKIK